MMRLVGIVSALIFALEAIPAARAQVMLDVAKITCEQFAGYKITTPENVAIWLSGYYHGKRGTTVVDMQKLSGRYENDAKILSAKSSNIGHECG
jgi:acid stress chaperone HdeB